MSQKISEKINKEISEYYKNKNVDEETKKSFDSMMLELKIENEMKNQKNKEYFWDYSDFPVVLNDEEIFNTTMTNKYFLSSNNKEKKQKKLVIQYFIQVK